MISFDGTLLAMRAPLPSANGDAPRRVQCIMAKTVIRDAGHIRKSVDQPSLPIRRSSPGVMVSETEGRNHMRKISFCVADVAVLILIGVGTWVGVGTGTSTPALAASTIDPFAMMTTATNLPASHYDDYSVVFN